MIIKSIFFYCLAQYENLCDNCVQDFGSCYEIFVYMENPTNHTSYECWRGCAYELETHCSSISIVLFFL